MSGLKRWQKNRTFAEALVCALRGIRTVLEIETNAKLQVIAFAIVLIASFLFRISRGEFLLIVIVSTFVFALELVNTAFEHVFDILHPEYHLSVRRAKDILAGAVLIGALGAVFVGAIIFLPRILGGIL